MSVRVYLPATVPLLAQWWAPGGTGEVPAGARAFAVTEPLRDELADVGDEEQEYVALTTAAQESVGLLDDSAPQRRVVLVADVSRAEPADGDDLAAVRVVEPVRLRDVAAVHVDSAEAEPAVAAAVLARHAGEAERLAALDRCLDHELGWYAAQELDEVIGLGGRPAV